MLNSLINSYTSSKDEIPLKRSKKGTPKSSNLVHRRRDLDAL